MKRKILTFMLVLILACSFVFGAQGTIFAQNIPIVDAYINTLSNHTPQVYSWTSPAGEAKSITMYSKYAIYDIDKNFVPEMIVEDVNDGKLHIYSFVNGMVTSWVDYADYFNCESFFEYADGNGIVLHGGRYTDEEEYIFRYSFSDNKLSLTETLYTGKYADDTITQLHTAIAGYKRIMFKNTPDLSLIYAMEQIKVSVNGAMVWFDQQPINENNRVLVPIRQIFESLGYSLEWNGETGTAVATSSTNTITVQEGNHTITYDGQSTYWCDVAPKVVSGRMMVPVRAVSESAGCIVNWNGDINLVEITSN